MSLIDPFKIPVTAPRPQLALLVHTSTEGLLVTRHTVSETDSGALIGVGSPLARSCIEELCDILRDSEPTDRESPALIDRRIVASSSRSLVWLMPAAVRPMWFKQGDRNFSLAVPWPHLLIGVSESGNMSVVAIKSTQIKESTPIYHAPLMNCYNSNSVCTGSAVKPQKSLSLSSINEWEAILTDTFFTHTNHGDTLNVGGKNPTVVTGGHLAFWRKLEKTGARRFPNKNLQPTGGTLRDFLASRSFA